MVGMYNCELEGDRECGYIIVNKCHRCAHGGRPVGISYIIHEERKE